MSDFDPVEIHINLKQNVDSEGEKATKSIDDVADASNKMKEQMEANINAQKAVIRQLTTEMDGLKKMLESKVNTPDSKLITEKQKLTEEVSRLKSELEQAEKSMSDLQSRQQGLTNEVVTGTAKMSQGMKDFAFSTKEELQESIAIQEKVISGLKTQLGEATTAFGKVNIGTQDPAQLAQREKLLKVVRELRTELKGEEAALADLQKQTVGSGQKMKTLETQIRMVREEMAQLKLAGKQNSQEYTELEKKLGTLGTAYREVFNTQKALSTGGSQMAGVLSGLSALSGVLSAGAGAFGLISSESEQFAKIQTKVQSLMAITIGLQQVSNTLHATSAFRITTVTKAKQLWTAANTKLAVSLGISTVAAKALMATLSLGLTVAIGVVIALIDKYATKQRKASEEMKKLNEGIANSSAEILSSYERLRKGYVALGNDLKAKEKFILENKDAFKKLGTSILDVNDADNVFIKNTEAFKTAMMERAKATAAMEIVTEKYKEINKKQLKADAMPDKVQTFVSQGQFAQPLPLEIDNSAKKKLEDEIKKEEASIEKLVNLSIDSYNKAVKAFKDAGLDDDKIIKEGTEAWWKKKQENAKDRLDALKDTQKGSEEWNKAVEDYNKATEKLKLFDISGTNKSEESEAKKAEKAANERLTAEQELVQKEIDIQLNKNKALVTLMDEGTEKLKAQAKQDYQERLSQLDEQEKGYLQQLNKSKNLKPADKGYVTSLATYTQQNPDDSDAAAYYSNLNQSRLIADRQYVKDSEKLERDAADARKKIWDQVYEVFMSDIDRQKKDINDFYDEKIKALTEASGTQAEIDQMNVYRAQELNQVQSDSALKLSSFYRDAFGDIDRYGTAALKSLKEQINEVIDSAKQIDQSGKTMIQVEIPTDEIDQDGKAVKETITMTIEEFNNLQNKANEVNRTLEDKNPFAAIGTSWENLQKAIESGDKKAISNALDVFLSSAESALAEVKQLGSGIREAFGDDAGDIADFITGMSEGALNIAKGIATGDPVAVLSGVVQVYSTLIAGAKEYRAEQKAWLNELIELQIEYNSVLNEQIRLQDQANVFITDYAYSAVNASKALADAQKNYNKTLGNQSLRSFLTDLDVKTGVKKKKFLGVTIGSKDIYGSLLQEYPELINSAGKFNDELAETLLDLDGLPTKTKQALEALIEYQQEIEAANEAIADAVKSLAGSLASDLGDSLKSAWKEGEDGFKAFKNTISTGLEDIISELAYNSVFSDSFTRLQEDLTDALTSGGSYNDIMDAFKNLYGNADDLVAQYNDIMNAAKAAAEAAGFDWSQDSESERTASSKGIATASQESVDENNGRLTAIQGFVYEIRNNDKQRLDYEKERLMYDGMIHSQLETIASNTAYCKYLESIKRSIDDMIIKGIRIKTP